ncbi:MAG TPA: prephenate dehydratase [Pyrinomonadaceae bacterium]|nr:prephenate dehydratase [Pyrinomonadaceae bacterium]
MKEGINNPRTEIDAIDTELLRLLNKRVEIALKAGEVKRRNDVSLCDHNRENEVLTRLCRQNTGPLSEQNVTSIFQRIMDECLHAQQIAFGDPAEDNRETAEAAVNLPKEARVAILGEHGSFSEEAAIRLLGETCKPVPRPTFESVFTAIGEKSADYILVPLENSLVGSVHRCYDLLLESSLSIAAEIIHPISHFLIGCPGASLESVKTVESHPVALAQCERFFAAHPHIERVSADDTASSVRRAVEERNPAKAAIGARRAANIYGGVILREHLEDNPENYTRFVLLASEPSVSNRGDKISLIIRLPHRPGALHDALRPFVRRGIDLLKIEGRPIKGRPWQYNFYLDLQSPASKSELRGALNEIGEQAEELRYLGQYASVNASNGK